MTVTDIILYAWTLSAFLVGLPLTLYTWWFARRARAVVHARYGSVSREARQAERGTQQAGWNALVQAIFLLIGILVIFEGPLRGEAVRWGLLFVQLGTVAMSVLDHQQRRRLLDGRVGE